MNKGPKDSSSNEEKAKNLQKNLIMKYIYIKKKKCREREGGRERVR